MQNISLMKQPQPATRHISSLVLSQCACEGRLTSFSSVYYFGMIEKNHKREENNQKYYDNRRIDSHTTCLRILRNA